jgi:hypothetical protein
MAPAESPLPGQGRLGGRFTAMVPRSRWCSFSACSRSARSPLSAAAEVGQGVRAQRARSPTPVFQVKDPMPSTDGPARSHSPGSLPVGFPTPQAEMSSGTGRGPNGRSTLRTVVSRAPTRLRVARVGRPPRSPHDEEAVHPRQPVFPARPHLRGFLGTAARAADDAGASPPRGNTFRDQG